MGQLYKVCSFSSHLHVSGCGILGLELRLPGLLSQLTPVAECLSADHPGTDLPFCMHLVEFDFSIFLYCVRRPLASVTGHPSYLLSYWIPVLTSTF